MSQTPNNPYGGDPLSKGPGQPQAPQGYNQDPQGYGQAPGYGQGAPTDAYGQPAPGAYTDASAGYAQPGYPQPGYAAGGYGQPGGSYGQPPQGNGMAVTGLVLGIFGLLLSWIPIINFFAIPLAIVGIILGILGISKANKGASGKGMALTGTILSGVALLSTIISLIVYAAVANEVATSLNSASSDLNRLSGNASDEILANELKVEFGIFEAEVADFGMVDSSLPLTITNTSDEAQTFSFTVQALDGNDNVIDTDSVFTTELQPGQTTTDEVFVFIIEADVDALKSATFKAVDASAY